MRLDWKPYYFLAHPYDEPPHGRSMREVLKPPHNLHLSCVDLLDKSQHNSPAEDVWRSNMSKTAVGTVAFRKGDNIPLTPVSIYPSVLSAIYPHSYPHIPSVLSAYTPQSYQHIPLTPISIYPSLLSAICPSLLSAYTPHSYQHIPVTPISNRPLGSISIHQG